MDTEADFLQLLSPSDRASSNITVETSLHSETSSDAATRNSDELPLKASERSWSSYEPNWSGLKNTAFDANCDITILPIIKNVESITSNSTASSIIDDQYISDLNSNPIDKAANSTLVLPLEKPLNEINTAADTQNENLHKITKYSNTELKIAGPKTVEDNVISNKKECDSITEGSHSDFILPLVLPFKETQSQYCEAQTQTDKQKRSKWWILLLLLLLLLLISGTALIGMYIGSILPKPPDANPSDTTTSSKLLTAISSTLTTEVLTTAITTTKTPTTEIQTTEVPSTDVTTTKAPTTVRTTELQTTEVLVTTEPTNTPTTSKATITTAYNSPTVVTRFPDLSNYCDKISDGTYAHPHMCRQFITCRNQETLIQTCAITTCYDEKTFVCNRCDSVDCGDRSPDEP